MLDNNVKKEFIKFTQSGDFKTRNDQIYKNINNFYFDEDDIYSNTSWLLDLSKCDIEFDSGNEYDFSYLIKTEYKDYYESIVEYSYFNVNQNRFVDIDYEDWEEMSDVENFGDDLQNVYPVLMKYDYEDYIKLIDKQDKLFNSINERYIKTFESFDKERLEHDFRYNRFGFDRTMRNFCDHMGYTCFSQSTDSVMVTGKKNKYIINLEIRDHANYFIFKIHPGHEKDRILHSIKDVLYNIQKEEDVLPSVEDSLRKINSEK